MISKQPMLVCSALALALALTCFPDQLGALPANRWLPIGVSGQGVSAEIDSQTLHWEGLRVTLWLRLTYATPVRGAHYMLNQFEIDCSGRTTTLRAAGDYTADDTRLRGSTYGPGEQPADPITPESLGELIARAVRL
jgi:hypothetical protein